MSAPPALVMIALLGASPAFASNGEWQAVPLPQVSGPLQGPGPARPSLQKVPAGTALADHGYEVNEYLVTERPFQRREHVLDRTAVRVPLGDRGFRKNILEVLQDDEAFLDHASFRRPQDGQRRRAACPLEQPLRTGTSDVDDVKVDITTPPLQLEENLEPL